MIRDETKEKAETLQNLTKILNLNLTSKAMRNHRVFLTEEQLVQIHILERLFLWPCGGWVRELDSSQEVVALVQVEVVGLG